MLINFELEQFIGLFNQAKHNTSTAFKCIYTQKGASENKS